MQSVHDRKKLTAYRTQSVETANQATHTNGKKRYVRGHRQSNSPSSAVNFTVSEK